MGKGDKKSKRGKIISGSYGVLRPKKKKNAYKVKEENSEKKTATKAVKEEKLKPAKEEG